MSFSLWPSRFLINCNWFQDVLSWFSVPDIMIASQDKQCKNCIWQIDLLIVEALKTIMTAKPILEDLYDEFCTILR